VDATLAVSSLSAINAIGNSLKTSNVMLMSFYPVVDSLPMSPYMITDPSHQTIFIGVSTFTQIAARAVRMQGVIVQRGAP
jgi:hypothetical protein